MNAVKFALATILIAFGLFVLYVVIQLYQWASAHLGQLVPWLIGLGLALGFIALFVVLIFFGFLHEWLRSRRLVNDLRASDVAFSQMKQLSLEAARVDRANHKVGSANELEVIYFFPQTAPASLTINEAEQHKQLASPLQVPIAPPFREMSHLLGPRNIILTYTAQGPKYGEVNDLLSMALIGKPKRGKTTALLYYLCILLKAGAEVWVWDPHGEMHELATGLHYYDRLEDIAASVPYLERELNERDELYKSSKLVKHPLVLLVDEVPVITDWEREQAKMKRKVYSPYRIMKRFTLEARKWNGYVFISGQSLPAQVLPTLTRDNLSSRLVLECSADNARMAGLPKDAIDTLLPYLKGAERGTHIADFSSWSKPELADIPYTTVDDLRNILTGTGKIFTPPREPIHDIHQAFTASPENSASRVVTGELVNATVNAPMNGGEDILEVSPEERRKIISLAEAQMKMYGRVVRTKILVAMGWNNKDYPKLKYVLDTEGL